MQQSYKTCASNIQMENVSLSLGTLDSEQPQTYAANIYGNNRPPQQQYNHDLSSNKYNPSWKEHPNQKWANQKSQHQ